MRPRYLMRVAKPGRPFTITFPGFDVRIEARVKLGVYDVMVPKQYSVYSYPVKAGRYSSILDAVAVVYRLILTQAYTGDIASQISKDAERVKWRDMPKPFRIDDYDVITKVIKLRGGCRCQDPGAMPPCFNCTEPITDDELLEIGVIDETDYYYLGGNPDESEKAP